MRLSRERDGVKPPTHGRMELERFSRLVDVEALRCRTFVGCTVAPPPRSYVDPYLIETQKPLRPPQGFDLPYKLCPFHYHMYLASSRRRFAVQERMCSTRRSLFLCSISLLTSPACWVSTRQLPDIRTNQFPHSVHVKY